MLHLTAQRVLKVAVKVVAGPAVVRRGAISGLWQQNPRVSIAEQSMNGNFDSPFLHTVFKVCRRRSVWQSKMVFPNINMMILFSFFALIIQLTKKINASKYYYNENKYDYMNEN